MYLYSLHINPIQSNPNKSTTPSSLYTARPTLTSNALPTCAVDQWRLDSFVNKYKHVIFFIELETVVNGDRLAIIIALLSQQWLT